MEEKFQYSNDEIGRLIKDGIDWYIQRLQKEEPDQILDYKNKIKELKIDVYKKDHTIKMLEEYIDRHLRPDVPLEEKYTKLKEYGRELHEENRSLKMYNATLHNEIQKLKEKLKDSKSTIKHLLSVRLEKESDYTKYVHDLKEKLEKSNNTIKNLIGISIKKESDNSKYIAELKQQILEMDTVIQSKTPKNPKTQKTKKQESASNLCGYCASIKIGDNINKYLSILCKDCKPIVLYDALECCSEVNEEEVPKEPKAKSFSSVSNASNIIHAKQKRLNHWMY